ncbi:DUF6377 domain-containing protein [Bacteroides sp. 224]|uniref:DUF6377 domain-containing protein n=1 Tax=Bacteroides sp. 224 TaxID=2302936 RepID=UPI0013D556AE|nr:DUF6377 domain-containing protein [Bacteroides sp. 224]NDV63699.1 hypothetical protein [Bacteroides sp. 224]
MKTHLIGISLIFIFISGASASGKDIYKDLDEALNKQEIFLHAKQTAINDLKDKLTNHTTHEERFAIYSQLHEEYQSFILDSAFTYITHCVDLAEQLKDSTKIISSYIHLGNLYTFSGLYTEALQIFNLLTPQKMDAPERLRYYHLAMTLYEHLSRFSFNQEIAANYMEKRNSWRDSILIYSEDKMLLADQFVEKGDYNSGIKLMEGLIPEGSLKRESALHYHKLSQIYKKQNNQQQEKKYLILSATTDITNSIKEYIALYELAFLSYEEGDIDRAYRYIHQCIDDANFCNAQLRTLEISRMLPLIDAAYKEKENRHREQIKYSLWFITLLSILLLLSLIYVYKQVKKLRASRQKQHEINARLKEMNYEQQKLNDELKVLNDSLKTSHSKQLSLNQNLSEANRVKEEYITRFLNLCATYLTKMENYRKQLNQIAATHKVEDLYKELKSKRFIQEEIDNFYKTFDNSFLHLYPNFVEKFNELLYPDERVSLKPDERLNTELRVYALLRLGITDSGCMADFLRYSASTIYNCRTKMRNKAINRDSFEYDVMRIG